jgi:DNA-binding IscR family transcriptional regulator
MTRLTPKQRAMLDLLRTEPDRGFDLIELCHRLDVPWQGASRTGSSLTRRGLAVSFLGGVGGWRVHYQSAEVDR